MDNDSEDGGLEKQRALSWVMGRHIDGTLPKQIMERKKIKDKVVALNRINFFIDNALLIAKTDLSCLKIKPHIQQLQQIFNNHNYIIILNYFMTIMETKNIIKFINGNTC